MRWEARAGVALNEGGDLVAFDVDRPGFHSTDSVDVNMVLSGTMVLELDDEEVVVRSGDVVVVNGSAHAWRNPGDETAVVLSVLIGASRLP